MLGSWTSRNLVFSVYFVILVTEIVASAWIVARLTREQRRDNNWAGEMMLAMSAWTMFFNIVYGIHTLRQRILIVVTVCLGILTSVAWFFFAIWTSIPATTCRSYSYCKFYKLICAGAWINTAFLLVVMMFPPNFQIIYRGLWDQIVACFVRLRLAMRLHLRQRIQGARDTLPGTFRCSVCMEDFPTSQAVRFAPCKHPFCQECARAYVFSKVEAKQLPILCPMCMTEPNRPAKKTGALDDWLLSRLKLTGDQKEAMSMLKMSEFSVLVDCPQCERATFVKKEAYHASKVVSCPSPGCQYAWCKSCTWSSETESEDAKQHSCDGVVELKTLMTEQGWKYCPGCRTPTERISGCNHMTCNVQGCFTHFCYPCGEAVPSSGFAKHNRRCLGFVNRGVA